MISFLTVFIMNGCKVLPDTFSASCSHSSVGKESVMQEALVQILGQKDLLENR